MRTIKNITVIGDGGWGTTLALHLLKKKTYKVTLWGPFPEYIDQIRKSRINNKFLPGIKLPKELSLTSNLFEALSFADLIVFAIPSQYTAATLKKMKPFNLSNKAFLSVTKGIDTQSLLRISEIFKKELGNVPFAVLSGPTIASEVARGIPSTAVVASSNKALAQSIQKVFNSEAFRIYTNSDVVGVELGGSIKNVIAIACGVCDGLGYGSNTKAAILTRGLAEMARLGTKFGADPKTFTGLSGLGDLVTTCISPQSRNRSVGELLGKGKSLRQILKNMNMVAEGVETAKSVYLLGQRHKIPMPITEEVYKILFQNKKPHKAVFDLMKRKVKAE
jgi:glycerol-3-phosphate dehydrogenase (NAD(P)+)